MRSNAARRLIELKAFVWTAVGLGLAAVAMATAACVYVLDESPILFESRESKTSTLAAVFNRVTYQRQGGDDLWMMEQSHSGPHGEAWDRLAIVVKTVGDQRLASFWQLAPGPLDGFQASERLDFKAKCYMCHANGPRVMRPNFASPDAALSLWDRVRLVVMNLRIKTYGPILPEYPQGSGLFDATLAARDGFKFAGALADSELDLPACKLCHDDSGWVRASLRRQHFLAVDFMLGKRLMPPVGFTVSDEDRERIGLFLKGGLSSLSHLQK